MLGNLIKAAIERLSEEGVVKDFYYDSSRLDGIIINKKTFTNENLEKEDYYLRIHTDFYNKKYIFSKHFGDGKFLNEYQNQESYVENLVKELNEDLKREIDEKKESIRNTINTQAVGEFIVKSILEYYSKDRDSGLYWINKEIESCNGDIYSVYTKDNIQNFFVSAVFEDVLMRNHDTYFTLIRYFLTGRSNVSFWWDRDLRLKMEEYILEETKKSKTSCHFNKIESKFLPKEILENTLEELKNSTLVNKVKEIELINNKFDDHILIKIDNDKSFEVRADKLNDYLFRYSINVANLKYIYRSDIEEFIRIESLIEHIERLI